MQYTHRHRAVVRRGSGLAILIGVILVAVALGLGWLFLRSSIADSASAASSAEMHRVSRGSFEVTVPASGELAALRQVEIRNPLETRAVITYIVDEGVTVQQGDLLVSFADEEIRNEIAERQLYVIAAENALTSATHNLEIQRSANTSSESQAITDLELAQIAYEQWEKGELVSKRKELELSLEKAERELVRLTENFEESSRLVVDGFISRNDYRRDEIAKLEAEAALETAQLDIEVFENYQFKRDQKEKQAAVDRAEEELARVRQENTARMESAEAEVEANQGELENRRQWLAYWEGQLELAEIRAPSPGLVVYASSLESDRRDERSAPEIGTEVRRNDRIIVLPDVSQMTADVKVHESISGRVQKGQRVDVVCDTLPNQTIRGSVMSVSVLAAGGSWRDPNRRDYTVRVLLEGIEGMELKPSMRCKAEIHLDYVQDALWVPIQAVYRRGPISYVYLVQPSGFAQREVQTGRASETRIEIIDGVAEGDRVILVEPSEAEVVERIALPETEDMQSPAEPDSADTEETPARGGGQSRGAMDPAAMISRFDANSDGSIQRDELPEQMQGMFDRMDADGDGSITLEEMQNLRPGG